MRKFLLFSVCLMLWLGTGKSFAQSTYGSISPLGGVTASINQELTFSYPAKTGASYYWSAYPSTTAIPSSAVEFTTSVTNATVKVKFKQAMIAFVCVVRYQPGAQPAHECISFNVVNCNTLPAPTSLTGLTTVDLCLPQVSYSTTNINGATSYEWSGLLSGNRITPGNTLTISANEFRIGNNTLRVRALNECGGYSAYYSRNIQGISTPAPTSITGPLSVDNCVNNSYTYSTNSITSALSYIWSGFEGGPDTTSMPSITLAGNVFATGSTTLSVQVLNNCGALSAATTLPIQSKVLGVSGAITGPTSVANCGTTTYTYSTPAVSNATNYIWSGFSTGTKSTTSPQLIVNVNDFANGNSTISVKARSACGIEGTSSSINVSKVALQSPTSINGPALLCGTGGTYTTQTLQGAVSYRWVGLASGVKTTSSPTLTVVPSDFVAGATINLAVSAVDACNNTSTSASMSVKYTVLPTLAAINGPTSLDFCNSQQANFSVSPVQDATSYTWTTNLGTITTNPSLPSVTVIIDQGRNPSTPYSVSVRANTACGTTNQVTLNGNIGQIAPPVISGSPTLPCEGGFYQITPIACAGKQFQYNWYANGQFVGSGTYASVPSFGYQNGESVDVRVEVLYNGLVLTSSNIFAYVDCLGGGFEQFSIQPNPTQQSFTVERKAEIDGQEVTVNLLRIDGTQISSVKSKNKKVEINSERLQPGTYLVEIITNGKREIRRVVKE